MKFIINNEFHRMVEWLLLAIAFYAMAKFVGSAESQLQTVLWKCGHATLGAFLGYWFDRKALGRVTLGSTSGRQQSRAMIMGAAVLGLSLGL